MKKTLIALGLAGASTAAFAQSTVTMFGIIDEGLQYSSNFGGKSQLGMDALSGPLGSRWGLQGSEDLGGGTKAIFMLEGGINLNNGGLGQGGLLFGRQAFVGLSSNTYGTVTAGRQYDAIGDLTLVFGPQSPWGTSAGHVGDIDGMIRSTRNNNMIKYQSPNWNGLSVDVTGTLGGVAGDFSRASAYSISALYKNAAYSFGVGYALTKNPSDKGAPFNSGGNAVTPDQTHNFFGLNSGYMAGSAPANSWQDIVVGGSYLYGNWGFAANWTNVRYGNIGQLGGESATFNTLDFSAKYNFTPFDMVSVAYHYTKGNAVGANDLGNQHYNQFAAMYVRTISKRTQVYVEGIYQIASGIDSTGHAARADIDSLGDSSGKNHVFARLALRHFF